MDDVLTQPWFIVLLGLILAIMMLSFGAMVFVKRKHMLMKQSALGTIRGKLIFILDFLLLPPRRPPSTPPPSHCPSYKVRLSACLLANYIRSLIFCVCAFCCGLRRLPVLFALNLEHYGTDFVFLVKHSPLCGEQQ